MARTIEFFLDLFQLEGNTLIPVSKVDADLECVKDKTSSYSFDEFSTGLITDSYRHEQFSLLISPAEERMFFIRVNGTIDNKVLEELSSSIKNLVFVVHDSSVNVPKREECIETFFAKNDRIHILYKESSGYKFTIFKTGKAHQITSRKVTL